MSIRCWAVGVLVSVFACVLSLAMASFAVANQSLGFESSSASASNADDSVDLLGGSHPYALTTTFKVNATINAEGHLISEGGDLKDLTTELPPGLIVDPLAAPRCGAAEFANVNSVTQEDGCPNASAVGVVKVENASLSKPAERNVSVYPLYDLAPPHGSPPLFGFRVASLAVYVTTSIRTSGDYGLTAAITNMPQGVHLLGSTVTLWGVPAQSAHDEERGDCIQSHGKCGPGVLAKPFLTLPTQCLAPPTLLLRADSWQEPGNFSAVASDPITGSGSAFTGCEKLDFSPSFHTQVESAMAGAPTGLKLDLHIPQSEDPSGLAESNLKNAVIALPPGMTLSLSRIAGLIGCPLEGPEGIDLGSSDVAHCPEASKIGTVKAKAPFLQEELQGGVYLAQQGNLLGNGTNPFGSLMALYIVAEGSGVLVKLPAEITADPQTSQLTVQVGRDPITGQAFAPQLPLEELELEFEGAPRASFVTPGACGSYTINTSLTPWSGTAPTTPADGFKVTQECTRGFGPPLTGGTVDKKANGFSPLTTTLTRADTEQELGRVSLTTPPGLLGILTGVPLCPEPEASLGTCATASLIGDATSSVGIGPEPLALTGGKVYLTGPYGGGPFGLSLVIPAMVGPLNLGPQGRPLVIRAAIHIDPITTQVTIDTGPAGPNSIPSILDGILPQIRNVKIAIDRPGFIFNPSNCDPRSITGMAMSTQGASASLSTPFQATSCAALPFSPKLKTSTVGRPSRVNGIGFNVRAVAGVAGEANARSVKVDLPKQLPSRLTTLQKACLLAVFEANPAGCPPGSIVGSASAVTSVLPVPLTGPAYFVSHGGAKFPELVIVLQGYGVTIDLHGETFISKAGITSSTFSQIPDAPVSSFELHLPAGSDSALTAHGDLCGSELRTPTTIIAQNGAVIKEDPLIAIGGCPPAIKIVRHSVHRRVVRIVLRLPSAGKLIAAGNGLTPTTKKIKKAGTVTIRLTPTANERRHLAHRRGSTLKALVKLLFIPSRGHRLSAHLTVDMH